MSDDKIRKLDPLDLILSFAFIGLWIWLRWWSGLWQNRWVGFALGAAFTLFLATRLAFTRSESRLSGFYPPKYLFLPLCIALVAAGIISFMFFLRRGSGDDGFSGFILISLGIQQANIYRRLSNQDRSEAESWLTIEQP